jgi:type IV secretion system protein VirB5
MNELNSPTQNFKPQASTATPYQQAREEWDNRIGSARAQAKNWRLAALLTAAVAIILAGGLITLSLNSTVTPYVVQVNNDGVVQAIGPAAKTNYRPSPAVIEYFLVEFVSRVRAIPLDPVLAKKQWLKAYDYLRPEAATTLNEIAIKEQPFARVGKVTVAIRLKSVLPLSQSSYQLRWEETSFSKEGGALDSRGMTGVFNIEIKPPSDEKTLRANPLGLFIKQFSWSRDL